MDSDDDDDDYDETGNAADFDDIGNDEKHVNAAGVHPDVEFEDECGYWVIKMLRGRSTGRRYKRLMFKFGVIHFIVAIVMLVIAVEEGRHRLCD